MSEEMATKKREETQRGSQADVFEKPRSVTRLVAHLCPFVATNLLPSTFLVRHSSVPEAVRGAAWLTASLRQVLGGEEINARNYSGAGFCSLRCRDRR